MVAPAMVMYWTLSLGEVFSDSLPLTLLRAGLVFVLSVLFLLVGILLVVGLEYLLPVAFAAL